MGSIRKSARLAASAISTSINVASQSTSAEAVAQTPRPKRSRVAQTAATAAPGTKSGVTAAVGENGRPYRASSSSLSELSPESEDEADVAPRKRRRRKGTGKGKGKATDVLDDATLPPRVKGCTHFVGAHVSAAGGVENAIPNARKIGANAFALFLKSQRKWSSPDLTEDSIPAFAKAWLQHDYKHVLPHGSYLVNLGNPDPAKRAKSYECFIDDLKRCEALGIGLFNFHPGSSVGSGSKAESMALIAQALNDAHDEVHHVVTVLENMAGNPKGSIIGASFEDLRDIIAAVHDKSRVGICIDTCHAFASGYDLRTRETYEATMSNLDDVVGLSYLRGMHLNDSKMGLGEQKDRHENIGHGQLGLKPFWFIMNDPRLANMPLIMETPTSDFDEGRGVWAKEIAALYALVGRKEDDWDDIMESLKDTAKIVAEEKAKAREKVLARGGGKRTKKKRTSGEAEEDEHSCDADDV